MSIQIEIVPPGAGTVDITLDDSYTEFEGDGYWTYYRYSYEIKAAPNHLFSFAVFTKETFEIYNDEPVTEEFPVFGFAGQFTDKKYDGATVNPDLNRQYTTHTKIKAVFIDYTQDQSYPKIISPELVVIPECAGEIKIHQEEPERIYGESCVLFTLRVEGKIFDPSKWGFASWVVRRIERVPIDGTAENPGRIVTTVSKHYMVETAPSGIRDYTRKSFRISYDMYATVWDKETAGYPSYQPELMISNAPIRITLKLAPKGLLRCAKDCSAPGELLRVPGGEYAATDETLARGCGGYDFPETS